jgi:CBS domain-containing protein
MARLRNRHLSDLVRDRAPLAVDLDATVQAACERMRDRAVGCVLVTRGDALVGILTGRDVVARVAAEARRPDALRVAEVMTAQPTTLPPSASALDALRCMQDGGFRHIPIVQDGRVIGVVSRGDFRAIEHAQLDEETGFWERLR